PRQRRADTEVDAVAERQVPAARAVEQIFVRRIEHRGVAVGRTHYHDHALARSDPCTVEIDVFLRFAHQELYGTVEAQRLFNGGIDQFRLAPQSLPEVRSVGEHVQQIAEQIRGGF